MLRGMHFLSGALTHRNIKKEFLPELIRYANERGLQIYAYIGKNTFNGTYGLKHPDANPGGAAELIPFHPGVHEYWEAFIRRIIEIGFNGFVFEDPEAMHVPNQNALCYKTFWEPWAKTYGFKFVGGTGYGSGKAELWCDGKRLLEFDTAKPSDGRWEADGVELRYLHGGDIRNETTTFGISGVYLLRLPASYVTPGKPLNLAARVPAIGGGDWIMVHEYRDVAEATARASIPLPRKPAITAFTPHVDGKFGVTIAEYTVR